MDSNLVRGLNKLLDEATDDAGIDANGLTLWALRRRRDQGRDVPRRWVEQERAAAVTSLAAIPVLRELRAALTGPIVLMKGPEIAARYPEPSLRAFGDLDLLVPDAARAQDQALALGYRPGRATPRDSRSHHQRTLHHPRVPLSVELHERPRWIRWLAAPPVEEFLSARVPSRLGVEGIDALHPVHHTLATAAHHWNHGPLLTIADLVDLALLREDAGPAAVRRQAESWRLRRVWTAYERTIGHLLLGEAGSTIPLSTWARNLPAVRERTILGLHASTLIAAWYAPDPVTAGRTLVQAITDSVRPAPGEPWRRELGRAWAVLRHAGRPVSAYQGIERRIAQEEDSERRSATGDAQ